jgi:hypothetical protein
MLVLLLELLQVLLLQLHLQLFLLQVQLSLFLQQLQLEILELHVDRMVDLFALLVCVVLNTVGVEIAINIVTLVASVHLEHVKVLCKQIIRYEVAV